MSSESKAQRHLFAAADKGAQFPEAVKVRATTTHAQRQDFMRTKETGLPQHVRQPRLSTMAGVKPAAAHGPAKNLGPYCHPKGGY